MYVIEPDKGNYDAAALKAAKDAADKIVQLFMKKYATLRLSNPTAFEKAKALLPDDILAKLEEQIASGIA